MRELTVVMAHAGAPTFLTQALRSLADQTLEGVRVLIVDDASGVNFPAVCAAFGSLHIDVLKNSTRLGLARSLNRALRACDTRFVARMDSDDVCLPERLAIQLNWLVERPAVAVLGTAVRYVDAAGRYWSRSFPITESEDLRLALLAYNQLAHGSIMARTEPLLEAGGYDESLEVSQDYDLWLRLMLRGHRVANIAEPYYEQRIHASSASASRRREQVAATRGIRRQIGEACVRSELQDFFHNNRQSTLGRPHERLQLGKLGLFAAYLASRPGVPLALRRRALAFAAGHAIDGLSALRAEATWRREWSRWLRLMLP